METENGTAATAPAAKRNGKRPFIILGIMIGALLAGVATYAFLTRHEETTDDAQVEADVVPLAARTGGQIDHLLVSENQKVKKGDTLVILDDADLSARLDQRLAELATAQAQMEAAQAQEKVVSASATGGLDSAKAMLSGSSVAVRGAEAQIEAAKAAVERAKADAHKSELDLARVKTLMDQNAIPRERYDNAKAADQSARASLAQAIASLTVAEEARRAAESRVGEARGRLAQSSPAGAQIAAAEAATRLACAKVKVSQAEVKQAELQLSYTRVYAPEEGVVSKLAAREGQIIAPGEPMAMLVPDRPYVVANFKETQIGRMKPGDRATVKVDAFPGRTIEGRVESLSGGTGARFSLLPPDNASGNFVKVVQRVPVRIELTGGPPSIILKAGLSVKATVYVK